MSQKKSEWEGVSGKLLYVCASRLDMSVSAEEYNKAIDDAIEEAVYNREKEIITEVEKMKPERDETIGFNRGWNVLKGKILSILKH